MDRIKLVFSREKAKHIIWEDDDEFNVIEKRIEDTSRWSINYSVVVQRISDGLFFSSSYSIGATESQDQEAYEYDKPEFTQVFKKEETITVYE